MVNIATTPENISELQEDHQVSSVTFQTLVFSLALAELAKRAGVPDVEIRGLSLKLRMRSTGTPRFNLGCEITEQDDGLEVVWLFRENLFSKPEIKDLGRLFQTVVESVCRVPESRTAALTS